MALQPTAFELHIPSFVLNKDLPLENQAIVVESKVVIAKIGEDWKGGAHIEVGATTSGMAQRALVKALRNLADDLEK